VTAALAVISNIATKYRSFFGPDAPVIVVDLSGSNLRGARLSGVAIQSLASSDVTGARLESVDIRNTDLKTTIANDETCFLKPDLPKLMPPRPTKHFSGNLPGKDFVRPVICAPFNPEADKLAVVQSWNDRGLPVDDFRCREVAP